MKTDLLGRDTFEQFSTIVNKCLCLNEVTHVLLSYLAFQRCIKLDDEPSRSREMKRDL